MPRMLVASTLMFALSCTLQAADWPQWMGPNRDDVWSEKGIVKDFKKGQPKELWRVKIGGGYAGPAVLGNKVYLADKVLKPGALDPMNPFAMVKVQAAERLLCFDAADGKELWKHEHDLTYHIQYPCGPRCTPLVYDGKVYSLGAMGDLFCLDAAGDNGKAKVLWSKNFPKDFGVNVPTRQISRFL